MACFSSYLNLSLHSKLRLRYGVALGLLLNPSLLDKLGFVDTLICIILILGLEFIFILILTQNTSAGRKFHILLFTNLYRV